MKLILNSDVQSLGRKGDVVDVAKGYARNYLLPKKLAIVATAIAILMGYFTGLYGVLAVVLFVTLGSGIYKYKFQK